MEKVFLIQLQRINVRAQEYCLLEAWDGCRGCGVWQRVWAFGLTLGSEYWHPDGRGGYVRSSPWSKVLRSVRYVGASVAAQVHELTEGFRIDTDGEGQRYWLNHCEGCGATIGDKQ